MKIFNPAIIIFSIVITLVACQLEKSNANVTTTKKVVPKAITKAQAIELAESFLTKQGYTNQATNITLSDAVFEPGEYASDIAKLLATRNNLLKLPAYGARQYGELNKWAVGFELVVSEENVGRGVSMDSMGGTIRLDPSDLRLDWIDEWKGK